MEDSPLNSSPSTDNVGPIWRKGMEDYLESLQEKYSGNNNNNNNYSHKQKGKESPTITSTAPSAFSSPSADTSISSTNTSTLSSHYLPRHPQHPHIQQQPDLFALANTKFTLNEGGETDRGNSKPEDKHRKIPPSSPSLSSETEAPPTVRARVRSPASVRAEALREQKKREKQETKREKEKGHEDHSRPRRWSNTSSTSG